MSFAAIFAFYEGIQRVKFKPFLSLKEQEIVGFFYEKIKIAQRKSNMITGLKLPLDSTQGAQKGFPGVALSEVLNETAIEKKKNVSLILIRDGKKMAIINNQIVKEGDLIGNDKVLRIEGDKVLIREGGVDRWLSMDQEEGKTSQKNKDVRKPLTVEKQKASATDENMEKTINTENDKRLKQIEDMKKWLNVK
ncbi:MAG: hypothetical protein NT178_00255 [Proteobacteria bacterium]|nr:hypothetical protein [Pseudomonadota bacterium]